MEGFDFGIVINRGGKISRRHELTKVNIYESQMSLFRPLNYITNVTENEGYNHENHTDYLQLSYKT